MMNTTEEDSMTENNVHRVLTGDDAVEFARKLAGYKTPDVTVREWAAKQYCSDTLLDQDRRMVAAETEAFLSGRAPEERSDLTQDAKNAGPVTDPEEWHNRQVDAMMSALGRLGIAPAWWGGTQFRTATEILVQSQEEL